MYPALLAKPPYIADEKFNLIITAGLLGSLVGSFGFAIPVFAIANNQIDNIRNCGKNLRQKMTELPDWLITAGTTIYGIYLFSSVVIPIVKYGGIIAALSTGRLEEYLEGGVLKGSTVGLFMLLPEVLYYFCIGKMLHTKRYVTASLLALLISIFYIFTANTRLPMIMPIMALGIVLVSKISRRWVPLIMPLIMAAGVFGVFSFSVIGNLIRGGLGSTKKLR